ncbi:MAG: hypothetical protein GY820_34055 [Gammaproteobacteria bacterium]|nr:hypothetical protein [Gammaproteobacteria bacterium]
MKYKSLFPKTRKYQPAQKSPKSLENALNRAKAAHPISLTKARAKADLLELLPQNFKTPEQNR